MTPAGTPGLSICTMALESLKDPFQLLGCVVSRRGKQGRWKQPEKKLGVTKALRRDAGEDLQGCQGSMWLDWWLGV